MANRGQPRGAKLRPLRVFTKKAKVNANVSVKQFLSLSVQGNDTTVDFGKIDPTTTHSKVEATKLKVKSNPNKSWDISVSKSDDIADYDLASLLTVSPSTEGDFSGTGTTPNILVDYQLDKTEGIPTGTHTVTVEFTVAIS